MTRNLALVTIALSGCAMPALLKAVAQAEGAYLPGVDTHGNLNMGLGGEALTKTYHAPTLGLTLRIATGVVTNQLDRPVTVVAQGTSIPAFNGRTVSSTTDVLRIERPARIRTARGAISSSGALARQISVFDAQIVCYMKQESDGTISCTCE